MRARPPQLHPRPVTHTGTAPAGGVEQDLAHTGVSTVSWWLAGDAAAMMLGAGTSPFYPPSSLSSHA
ncbi:hypothetical protein BJ956_002800 [Arthrobacter psychrochitiniphilus]|uniref:hypothetical protein n=1 Tax=Arthrobacter sp. lap29 TaxID=3056122 RepID=UPI0018243789|nr:hypothetical protein [Arthrobacter sp. lap29]NYG18281.1 hypothetical protein [Arthrobacter psychrochitiniphilus]